jgi:hypothetical protein
MDDRGFESGQRLGIFLFTTVSRPDPGALFLEIKRLEREADH